MKTTTLTLLAALAASQALACIEGRESSVV